MIFYKGYPRANGTTDFCDSAVLAGLLSVFHWPNFEMPIYENAEGLSVRCPDSDIPDDKCRDPKTMTRDQILPLVTGYNSAVKQLEDEFEGAAAKIQTLAQLNSWRTPNGDLLSPSHRRHLRICAGSSIKYSWFERLWLKADILFHAKVTPLSEPNQLICQLIIAGPEFVQYWCRHNTKWKESITEYWCGWRDESSLANLMIETIETITERKKV